MKRKDRLKKIVSDAKLTEEFAWLADLAIDEAVIRISRPGRSIPRKHIIDIYTVRSMINESKGSPIEGYGNLLSNLKKNDAGEVVIHTMTTKRGTVFMFFTDLQIDSLIGVLRSVKSSLASD